MNVTSIWCLTRISHCPDALWGCRYAYKTHRLTVHTNTTRRRIPTTLDMLTPTSSKRRIHRRKCLSKNETNQLGQQIYMCSPVAWSWWLIMMGASWDCFAALLRGTGSSISRMWGASGITTSSSVHWSLLCLTFPTFDSVGSQPFKSQSWRYLSIPLEQRRALGHQLHWKFHNRIKFYKEQFMLNQKRKFCISSNTSKLVILVRHEVQSFISRHVGKALR